MITDKRKKNNSDIIVGLDVGTTKICAIVGEVTDDGVTILAVSSQPSSGLKKGVVIDIEATAQSIKKAVAAVEEQAGIGVREVYVGIAGSHIKSLGSYGTIGIKGKEVTREDVDRAIDSASAVYVPLDREVLHILPTDFILDGQDGIKDPVGMSGIRLEVKVFIITGAVTSVQNLLKCCERAGLEVVDIVLQPLASSEATLTPYEREMGVTLIDIGGGTTDIAVYKDDWLCHTAILGIGGNHFTNDLSIGLRLPFHEAERVKKQHGTILPSELNDMTEVDVVAIDGQVRGIPGKYLSEILQPRGEELLGLIRKELQMIHGNGIAISGVVLTGGSSLLSGFDRVAEAVLSMPVRIGYPDLVPSSLLKGNNHGSASELQRINKLRGEFNNPMYATGIGLVLYGAGSVEPAGKNIFSADVFGRIAGRMNGWFKRITGNK